MDISEFHAIELEKVVVLDKHFSPIFKWKTLTACGLMAPLNWETDCDHSEEISAYSHIFNTVFKSWFSPMQFELCWDSGSIILIAYFIEKLAEIIFSIMFWPDITILWLFLENVFVIWQYIAMHGLNNWGPCLKDNMSTSSIDHNKSIKVLIYFKLNPSNFEQIRPEWSLFGAWIRCPEQRTQNYH